MRLLLPLEPRPSAPLARANPLAKLGAALVLLVALLASLDGVTAAVILAALIALVPASGLDPFALVRRSWLVGLTAISIGLANVLFAPGQAGATLVELGPVRIGSETLLDGLGLSVRLLAIGLAGILATATSQPTDIADALIQQLRVSPRFAVGTLAAIRLIPTLARDWQTAALARRARGVDAGRSPLAAASLFAGLLLALLVGAVRRATRLSRAMQARGLGARECRSVARIQRMRPEDWGWLVGAVVLAAGAVGVSVALGTWRPLLG
ncbi:MAG: energy-coupling factor transporter transmembrane component T [Chloroflexota bacterium]